MAIVFNGTSIPTNGDYIVVNGVKVEKVIANRVVVWQKETASPAKNAPPFLSAGWQTITPWRDRDGVPGWQMRYEDNYRTEYIVPDHYWEREGTRFISENRIDIYIHLILSDVSVIYGSYLVHSPAYLVGNFTSFSLDLSVPDNHPDLYTPVARYSNDKTTWTDWISGSGLRTSYKYVQVGLFAASEFGYSSDVDSNESGTNVSVKGVTFS